MERRRAAGALLALAACILCTAAAPTASNHTALDIYDGQPEGCYYNFQHYGEGDRIMTNEPCLNCTCHNRMLMCYLRVCPFTKPIGQDCTVEKRADQCCPIVTCPDVPVDLLTLTSTTSPAEYGATGVGKLDKYGCSINGKYFPEGSKVPPSPNKPCEHCYCIRNMTTCVMQECTLHVDGCTPIYLKDVCCPVRYSCDHSEDEIPLLDDKTTTVRPTPGFLLTTTTLSPVTQMSQDCVHDDQIFPDGASIKTEKSCEHCYCMKGDIVCVVQDCGTPMENEGKNCTALPPREGQCCPDTYICEGDELTPEYTTELTTQTAIEDMTTLSPPRRVGVEGSGYRKEPDNIAYTEQYPVQHEGSGDAHEAGQALDINDVFTTEDNTKYSYSTTPSIENTDNVDIEQDSKQSTTDVNVIEDNLKPTTAPDREQEVTRNETAALDKIEQTTSSIPSYDHKLETSQPEVQTTSEKESYEYEDKISHTTIAPIPEEKDVTTAKPYEEKLIIDEVTIQHDKLGPPTISPILEDEGITTESDRELQTISIESGEDHSYVPGLHAASTTSAPFLEEVEETPVTTYEQHVVTDGITESDIHDSSKNKPGLITTPIAEVTDNVKDTNKFETTETAEQTTSEGHEFAASTTSVPISSLETFEKTTKAIPEDLTTIKFSEQTQEDEKIYQTPTSKPVSEQSEESVTDHLQESSTSSESLATTGDLTKPDVEVDKSQTEKYDLGHDEKVHDIQVDISTTLSVPIVEQNEGSTKKPSEKPTTISSEVITSEITSKDKYDIGTTRAPIQEDYLVTLPDKDAHEPQEEEIEITSKPSYIEDSVRKTTQEIEYDIITDKIKEQDYESQKPSYTSAPISEEAEMTTTEFIKDQDYVTSGPIEQESLKPGDYVSSTSSTPFLEEIEKLTTETSHGYVVTDIITEKDDSKPMKQVPTVSETLPSGAADITTSEPDKGLNTIPSGVEELESSDTPSVEKTTQANEIYVSYPYEDSHDKEVEVAGVSTMVVPTQTAGSIIEEDKIDTTTEPSSRKEDKYNESEGSKQPELVTEVSYESPPTTDLIDLQDTKSPSSQPEETSEELYKIQENVPSQEPTTERILETSRSPDKSKPEVEEAVASSTQITPNLPEATTVNLFENEIDEDSPSSPGRIPGEGDCLLNGVTYMNETAVPSINKCHSDCRCVSSIIKCNPIICSPPPEYMDNCQPTYDSPDSCCPSYVCDQFRETLPPMPHVHITTTEIPQQTSSIDCRGDQCEIHEDKIQPATSSELCAGDNCGSETDKKTASGTEFCTDGKCTPVLEDCSNGECKHSPVTDSPATYCVGEKCDIAPVILPHAPVCENGENCEEPKSPEMTSTPCIDGDNCKGTDENIVQDCADETCRRKQTSDIEEKPSICAGSECEKETPVDISTSGDITEIKADAPKLHEGDVITTEEPIQETIGLEMHDIATELGDYGTTIIAQPTTSTPELDSHKEPYYPVTQGEPKLPESASEDMETITETYKESRPTLDSGNDELTTKIDQDSHQISTDTPDIQTHEQHTFETSKPDDEAYTEPTKYALDSEENTVKTEIDEIIPTKQPVTVEFVETIATTSKSIALDHETLATEVPKQEGASEAQEPPVTESQEPHVTESQERTTLSEVSVTETEKQTQAPLYTVHKSEDIIPTLPTVDIGQDTTTDYRTTDTLQTTDLSVPIETTLTPSGHYVPSKETGEKTTESETQKDVDEYTHSQESATKPQSVSSESLTPASTETSLPDVTITSGENTLQTESGAPVTEENWKEHDEVTEENLTSPETDKIPEIEKEETASITISDAPFIETVYSTSEPSSKGHEVNTEHELHISVPEKEGTTELQKDAETTSPIVDIHDIPVETISEQDVTESTSSIADKIEEEPFTATQDSSSVSTEPSEFLTTKNLDQNTEKSQDIEKELTQTENTKTPTHDSEPVTDISIEKMTIPEHVTEYPEILSHKKEHTPEPTVTEIETQTTTKAEDIDVMKQKEPSIEKTTTSIASKQEAETERMEIATEDPHASITKDKPLGTQVATETTAKPILVHQEASTVDTYVSDLEKSTEHGELTTGRPQGHETEVFTPIKQEPTTITSIEKETVSGLPEMIPITDKHDVDMKTEIIETSTSNVTPGFVSPQSYEPGTEEPEIIYTEKAEKEMYELTTKSFEAITPENTQEIVHAPTSAPEIQDVITEKLPVVEDDKIKSETTVSHETTETSMADKIKEDELATEVTEKYDTEQDLESNVQDDSITEIHELITEIPEIYSTVGDQLPGSPVTQTLVTETQDTSKVPDVVTEYQKPVTEVDDYLSTEQPEIKEPVKPTEEKPLIVVPKDTTEIPMTMEVTELQGTTGSPSSNIVTDHDNIATSSATPDVTEIESIDVTQNPYKPTTILESSSEKEPAELSTSSPQEHISELAGAQTDSSELVTEEPIKSTSRLPDIHKLEIEDTVTESLTTESKPLDESLAVSEEKDTETTQGFGISTESPLQPASESHDISDLTEPTSAPVHEVPETTPYLIELQEHTHKILQEETTTSVVEEESTTEQIVSVDIEHQRPEPEITTETVLEQQTETKHYEETSTPAKAPEKTTQIPIAKDEESLITTQSAHIDIKETTEHKYEDITTSSPTHLTEMDKESTPENEVTDRETMTTTSEKTILGDVPVEITTPEEVSILPTEKATTVKAEELPTQSPIIDKVTKPEEKPSEIQTPSTDLSKPGPSNIQPTDEVPSPDEEGHFPPSGSSGYGSEPDYVEEDQAFGPGTCRYGGKVYVSAQQIPRDDPCDFCFCFRSDIICLQQSCPPPIHGCHEEPIQGFCCPRYECPVSMATTLNVTTTTTTTTTTLPPHFPTHSYKGAAQRRGCQIKGHIYKVGEVVRGSSGPCLHCTCGGDGQMKCDPKACTPEPMLRQMIAAAVSAKRRR